MIISKLIDLTGQKFGRLTVVCKAEPQQNTKWWCKCDCGNPNGILVYGNNLKRGLTTSCGCVHREKLIERNRKENIFIESDEFCIGIDSNKNEFKFDKSDYEIVSKYNWFKTKNGYFAAIIPNSGRKHILLHRLIMNINNSEIDVDHINHDTSDNRKNNLRLVTASQNASNMKITSTNKSGIKGVYWDKRSNKWGARAMKNYKSIHLGYYNNIDDAKNAREQWEVDNQKEYRYQKEQDVVNNA